MAPIPFPISSAPGKKQQEGGGRLINCRAEKTGEGARSPVVWIRTAGLRQELEIASHVHLRGGILVGSTLVVAMDTRVYAITSAFAASNLGALSGTDPITVASNNAATPNIVAVCAAGVFNLFTASAPTSFVDSDLPSTPTSVSSLAGYFLFTYGDGRIFASDLNAVTVSSSAFTTEQGLGGLLRGVSFRGEFFAFGARGVGVYRDIGASPFPLERQPYTIKRGLAGTHAVAGYEPGWSNELLWVGDDGVVYRLNGYNPDPVSNDDVARVVAEALKDGFGPSLEASVYMEGKHAIWSLTNPGVWTWEYNLTTQNWNERESFGRDDWRASRTIRAFNRWLAGDRTTGKIADIDVEYYREYNDAMVWTLRGGAFANFPGRIGIPRADFDFTAAVGMAAGDVTQSNPTVLIRWSLDGGYTFGNPVARSLGGEGQGGARVSIARGCGTTKGKGIVFEFSISDPVHVGFQGAQVPAQSKAA